MRKSIASEAARFLSVLFVSFGFVMTGAEANEVKRNLCEFRAKITDAKLASVIFNAISAETEELGDSAVTRTLSAVNFMEQLQLRCSMAGEGRATCDLAYAHHLWWSEQCEPMERMGFTSVLAAETSSQIDRVLKKPISVDFQDSRGRGFLIRLGCWQVRSIPDGVAPSCRLEVIETVGVIP